MSNDFVTLDKLIDIFKDINFKLPNTSLKLAGSLFAIQKSNLVQVSIGDRSRHSSTYVAILTIDIKSYAESHLVIYNYKVKYPCQQSFYYHKADNWICTRDGNDKLLADILKLLKYKLVYLYDLASTDRLKAKMSNS